MLSFCKETDIFCQVQEFTIFNNRDTMDLKSELFSVIDDTENLIFSIKFILLLIKNCFEIYPLSMVLEFRIFF